MTALLGKCCLIPPAARREGNCQWCGKELPRTKDGRIHKSRRWCNKDCSKAYGVNHFWNFARRQTLVRDGHRCTQCSKSPNDIPRPDYAAFVKRGLPAYHQAIEDWELAVKPLRLEVHHLHPVKGKGYKASCLHHQSNLRTLCYTCHRRTHA